MADVKHCTASPSHDFEGFLHIFYCRIKNFMESLTEKLLRQVGWQGWKQINRNSPHDVRSPDCRVLTQTYSPNLFSSRFWRVVVSFTVNNLLQKKNRFFFLDIDVIAFKQFPLVRTSLSSIFDNCRQSRDCMRYSLIPPINDNVTERLRITSLTGFAIYETWTYTTVIFRTKVA